MVVLGENTGSSGTYVLSGSGLLTTPAEYIGYAGPGSFLQSGGTHAVTGALYLGAGADGTYNLSSAGLLTALAEYVGASVGFPGTPGTGSFTQSGGTNAAASLYVSGAGGTYNLSGSGLLSVSSTEAVLGAASPFPGGAATWQQTGGTNVAGYVNLGGGRYVLSGGLLELSGGLQLAGGTLSGGTAAGVIQGGYPVLPGGGTIVDLSQGSLVNTADISLSLGANSLVIVSQGFNPAAVFQTYSNPGMTHTLGTTLTVSAGTGFGGWATITDPVVCQGSIVAAPGGAINLTNGLTLSGTGQVNLGTGALDGQRSRFADERRVIGGRLAGRRLDRRRQLHAVGRRQRAFLRAFPWCRLRCRGTRYSGSRNL